MGSGARIVSTPFFRGNQCHDTWRSFRTTALSKFIVRNRLLTLDFPCPALWGILICTSGQEIVGIVPLYCILTVCDPSDQNKLDVGKLLCWENSKIWSKSFFSHFQILIKIGSEICCSHFWFGHLWHGSQQAFNMECGNSFWPFRVIQRVDQR